MDALATSIIRSQRQCLNHVEMGDWGEIGVLLYFSFVTGVVGWRDGPG